MNRLGWSAWFRRGAVGAALVGSMAVALTARVHFGATAAMERSDEAFHHGSLRVALSEAREAALWYLPFSSNQRRSYERLRAIAIGAESEGNTRLAQRAWEAMRAALLETAHPVPLGDSYRAKLLQEANVQLVRLLADSGEHASSELRDQLLTSYQRSLIPSTERVVSRSAGMLLILLTGVALVLFRRGPIHRSLLLAPLSLGLFLWVFSVLGA